MLMNEILYFFAGHVGTALGTLSSVISLILTVIIFINVKNIRKYYAFTARVPELSERIASNSSLLNNHLNSYNGMTVPIRTLLAETEVLLVSLSKNVDGSLKKDASYLIKNIKTINASSDSFIVRVLSVLHKNRRIDINSQKMLLENIYISLCKISATCNAKHEDDRWER